jgi:DNA polymerase IV
MDRTIVHFDIPDFYTTLEELRHPELKNHPVVLAEPHPRAPLQGINAIARLEGLKEGMVLSHARRLCRRIQVIPPDHRFYREQHDEILKMLGYFSPLIEGTLLGHYFIDLTGTRRLWGPASDTVYRMEKELKKRESVLACAGLAHNKLVSQVAAKVIPPGDMSAVFPGEEASFLAPLPVHFLPGVGPKTSSLLDDFNIQCISELATLPEDSFSSVFGRQGLRLIQFARGIDSTPVIPSRKASVLSVDRILDRDEIDRDRLTAILFQQVEEAAWMLRRCNRNARVFSLEIRYADGISIQGHNSLGVLSSNLDLILFNSIEALFLRLFTRRIALRRISLEFRELSMPSRQLSLFETDSEAKRMQEAIDRVRRRFGRGAISWGKTVMTYRENAGSRDLKTSLAV